MNWGVMGGLVPRIVLLPSWAGLVAAIHVLGTNEDVDARHNGAPSRMRDGVPRPGMTA